MQCPIQLLILLSLIYRLFIYFLSSPYHNIYTCLYFFYLFYSYLLNHYILVFTFSGSHSFLHPFHFSVFISFSNPTVHLQQQSLFYFNYQNKRQFCNNQFTFECFNNQFHITKNKSGYLMTDCNDKKQQPFREVKLKGKITGKTAYMVIIDEDDQNSQPQQVSPSPNPEQPRMKSMYMQRIVEQQIQRQLSVVTSSRTINLAEQQSLAVSMAVQASKSLTFPISLNCEASLTGVIRSDPWMKKTAIKTVIPTQNNLRRMTRSSKCKSQYFYDEKNYAKIPQIVDHTSFEFKKLLIKKCVSLRNREYIKL